ncbi:type I-E CRISPR-associated protein Cas6/Cse3/CasE [Actinosynnema pretiosum subsp. pretiosum]|uniref:CRISPR-associated protein, Cse3 family n=2 Tax=Actinosynnema TaxID=40566 RepID=C6WMQ8_ACTMD|nr:type I-E CRISPR-associated protein Cas6/Cse3/CasE [Actinosynnema mirum]ACU36587.1 CRISPR-associated protein, Cse3 family [Actinosynnema mirum DSM 43827]AXX30039.1 CRISPR-associated protein, Cse3 family [Actinosynnema pretiosum subsp. pretiosum]QUF05781.1 type I-E CRISPR-associated protein Cas6/Cse3/CasE [Actinosynnema pretiosum subsp. pretiosum]
MFLTKLTVDVRSREFRRDLANLHEMHRTVMSGYPRVEDGSPARQTHGVLWRLDATPAGYTQYVQSLTRPDWTGLPETLLTSPAEVRSLDPLLDAIEPGRVLAFRLLANATKDSVPAEPGGRGLRVAHRTPEAQVSWLARKGQRHGFALRDRPDGVPDVTLWSAPRMTGRKKAGRPITVDAVRFDGHLVVTDADELREAVGSGIGRAKAYGCGMLSLARARIDLGEVAEVA